MPGSNEVTPAEGDEALLASTDMRALLQVSPKGLAALDKDTDGAASKFKALVEKAVANTDKKPE